MDIGKGRHLRQVGDHDDLMGVRQLGQAPPDLHRRAATDTGVDLVEHHGGPCGRGGEHHLER
ncbi:Uncharacterised protein [Mycobacteroides abscessus subsp. massiliense]|nr:Uncharacterised protein [Mycobacteroides abscessus subsp. massiliense]